jgi:hypothetical protein
MKLVILGALAALAIAGVADARSSRGHYTNLSGYRAHSGARPWDGGVGDHSIAMRRNGTRSWGGGVGDRYSWNGGVGDHSIAMRHSGARPWGGGVGDHYTAKRPGRGQRPTR